jgi:hypothetical protein
VNASLAEIPVNPKLRECFLELIPGHPMSENDPPDQTLNAG